MASGYQIDGDDLDDLLEPFVASEAENSFGADLNDYETNGLDIGMRYQKANTDSWAKTITLPYCVEGDPVIGVQKGCLPTQTKFAELTSTGTFNISVTDSSLTIGSTTYPASHFRNGVIPKYIGVMICGGGGGAGGWGCDEGDKDGYNVTQGGGGGGAGIAFFVARTDALSSVKLGLAGGAGSHGSSDSRPSTGGTGASGRASYVYDINGTACYTVNGGGGGTGGKGASSSSSSVYGTGGAGGTVSYVQTDGIYHCLSVTGGKGGNASASGGQGTSVTSFSFTTGAGINTSTMFNNPATGYSYTSGDSFRDTWSGGGCSIGSGGISTQAPSFGGGGCACKESLWRSGTGGYCAFYY